MDLSIVIPVWNEEKKIGNDLNNLHTFLSERSYASEIIVVDDGSNDSTCKVVQEFQKNHSIYIELLCDQIHHGKGYAVRKGIRNAKGKRIMFMDCGGNVPLDSIDHGLTLMDDGGFKLAHGSRHLPRSYILKPMSPKRRLFSWLFRKTVRNFLPIPRELTDTQCGFKLYDGDTARELYARPTLDGFLFDVEIILRARSSGYSITEFPITWSFDPDSRLHPNRIFSQIVRDLIYLKRTY